MICVLLSVIDGVESGGDIGVACFLLTGDSVLTSVTDSASGMTVSLSVSSFVSSFVSRRGDGEFISMSSCLLGDPMTGADLVTGPKGKAISVGDFESTSIASLGCSVGGDGG